MAGIFAESFDKYGTNTALMLDGLYTDVVFAALVTSPAPPHGTYALSLNVDGSSNIRFALPDATQKKIGVAGRYYFPNLPAGNNAQTFVAMFNDVTNVSCVGIAVMTTGALQALNSDGTVIGTTTNPVITANGWHHIECYTEVSGAGAGVVKIYVDGALRMNLTGKTMVTNNNIAQIKIGRVGGGGGAGFYLKDLLMYDTQGSHNNAAPIGDCQVVLDTADGAGTNTAWTPTTPPAYTIMANVPPVDTAYISQDTTALPKASSFTTTNLPPEATGVKWVQVVGRQWKSDAGTATIQQGVISNAVTAGGTDRPISTLPTYYWDVFETDPNTGATWGVAAVNAMQVNIKRTS